MHKERSVTQCAIGIDLGGTFIKAGVVDAEGRIVTQLSVPTGGDEGAETVIRRMAEAADEARRKAGLSWAQAGAVGIGSPGVLDLANGVVLTCPNIHPIEGLCLTTAVVESIGEAGVHAVLENDANAAAYAEAWVGAGRDASSLVMMTLGTGIGGGIILNGEIWHGAHGFAGEIGHMTIEPDGLKCPCGNRGCLERYASAAAMERRFRDAIEAGRPSSLAERVLKGETVVGRDIDTAAREGDELARETLNDTGRYLGIAATNIAHVFDPDMIVFAGGLVGAGDLLMEPLQEEARRRMFAVVRDRVRITFAELGKDAGLIGAAGWALKTYATSAS